MTTSGRALFTVAVLLVLTAACATEPGARGGGGAGGKSPASGTMSSGPLPPSSGGAEASNVVVPEPARSVSRHRWTRVQPASGGSELLVYGTLSGGPPCSVLARVDVVEAEDHVAVTLWTGRRPDADCDGPQPALAFPFVTRVRLKAPLGDRRVVDGASPDPA